MTPRDLIDDLRSRINPAYATQLGTESYERRLCAEALEAQHDRLEVLEREHAEFFERWHGERRKREAMDVAMRDIFPAAHRLALELECLLLDTKDTAAVSKWWDSAHEALEQWREFCREDAETPNVELTGASRNGEASSPQSGPA